MEEKGVLKVDNTIPCGLFKYKKIVETHWVGRSGKLYPINEYSNHGKGGMYFGKKDLPTDDYPYKIKYRQTERFKCCRTCNCDK